MEIIEEFKEGVIPLSHRTYVLDYSLRIERLTSVFLLSLLQIDDRAKSRCFGFSSSALSFAQKIDLLIDVGALDSEAKKKFQQFMEIRNKMMHLDEADSYNTCLSMLESGPAIKKAHLPTTASHLSDEEKAESAVKSLCKEVAKLTDEIIKKVLLRQAVHGMLKEGDRSSRTFFEIWRVLPDKINEHLAIMCGDSEIINREDLNLLGRDIQQMISDLWKDYFSRIEEIEAELKSKPIALPAER